jgi:hypothetical protein
MKSFTKAISEPFETAYLPLKPGQQQSTTLSFQDFIESSRIEFKSTMLQYQRLKNRVPFVTQMWQR